MNGSARTPGPVDWVALRRRAVGSGKELTGEVPLDPAERRRILDERARALAQPPPAPPPSDTLTLLAMTLSGETWGVDARFVWDVFPLAELTPLPGAAPSVVGLTPWRGSVLTVLDPRPMLAIPAPALTDLAYGVVIGEEAPVFGLLADTVREVAVLDPGDVGEPPEGVAAERDFVLGMAPGALFVLDVARLLRQHLTSEDRES